MISEFEVKEMMMEWLHRLHISEDICFNSLELYRMEIDQYLFSSISKYAIDARIINTAVFAIYTVCREKLCVVTMSDLCTVSGANIKNVWKIVKRHSIVSAEIIKPCELVHKYAFYLKLNKNEIRTVLEHVKNFERFYTHSPKTLIAYSIYINSKEKRISKMSINYICKSLQISSSCIFRFAATIKKYS